jgi:putrescine transport system substrate-binding protein
MAIPADAPHPGNALLFINYILRPEVAAGLTNKVFYANPNKASLKFVQKDIASNPSIFVKPEDIARMAVPDSLPQDAKRVQTRTFTEFKTGVR